MSPKQATPPLPSSGMKGIGKAPTTKLPPPPHVKPSGAAGATGKVVVMLSSVAKAPPISQRLQPLPSPTPVPAPEPPPAPVVAPPKVIPPDSTQTLRQPPPLPPPLPSKQAVPPQVSGPKAATPMPKVVPPQSRLSATTFVKLPPKTAEPSLVTLTSPPIKPERKEPEKVAPPLLPAKGSEPVKVVRKTGPIPLKAAPPLGPAAVPTKSELKKTNPIILNQAPPLSTSKADMRKTGKIILNPPSVEPLEPEDSIFAPVPNPSPAKPAGWKSLQPGELPPPAGGLKDVDIFARTARFQPAPPPVPTIVEAKDKPAAAPPVVAKAGPALNPAPIARPPAKPAEPLVQPLHVAPPLVEKAREETIDKLPPPHRPEPAKTPAPEPAAPPIQKAPAMVEPEKPPAKPMLPPPLPSGKAPAKGPENKLKKSAPIVLGASTASIVTPGIAEARPALKPAVLPKRSQRPPEAPAPETPPPVPEKQDGPAKTAPAAKAPEVAKPTSTEPPAVAKGDPAKSQPVKVSLASTGPMKAPQPRTELPAPGVYKRLEPTVVPAAGAVAAVAAAASSKKPTLPPTRSERAKRRRLREAILFWVVMVPAAAAILFVGILHFGRDTRVEGQVIPPDGMTLSDEVWIVTNFSSDAAGIADDLAKERAPIQQEIQERRDHVQRAQADIAAREERIRLIQENIQSAKDEINAIVKKSRDAAQAIWDGEGAEIGQDYDAHKESLRKTIAERAASLKLQYTPDPNFPAPEVWANAYRLALYETPPGVDGVKEHQWLGDQMKQWRDYEKSLDDRKEQLREKAAALKLEPAQKLADLNSKIDDLTQRIQGTQAEEEPLKAELAQAQSDLTAAEGAEVGLDDKYFQQLYSLPSENITYHISLKSNGRFTWLPDTAFAEGEVEHKYWIFARAIRADGRQYWALHRFPVDKNEMTQMTITPGGFQSTKAILRPNLPPEEIEQ